MYTFGVYWNIAHNSVKQLIRGISKKTYFKTQIDSTMLQDPIIVECDNVSLGAKLSKDRKMSIQVAGQKRFFNNIIKDQSAILYCTVFVWYCLYKKWHYTVGLPVT